MNEIKKSYLSVFPLLLLLLLPGLVRWMKIKSRDYSFDEKNLHVEEGVFKKESISIPLIKVESVQAKYNIFGNGTILINARVVNTASDDLWNLEYVKHAKKVRREIMAAVDAAREKQGVKPLDTF